MPKQAGAVELTYRRTEDAKHWLNPDGTRTAEFGDDQYYPDASGDFQPVDLNFRQVSTTEWVAERSRHRVRAYREAGVNWLEITQRPSGKGIRYQIPLSATVGTNYVEFTGFSLTWRYYLTRRGVKLESSPVASSLGPKSYDFTVQLVGGATLAQVANAAGGLDGDSFLIPRAQAHCADGVVRDLSAWSRSGSTATFSMDDSSFPPGAYPYTVDPTTTFPLAEVAADDVYVYKVQTSVYPPGGAVLRTATATHAATEKFLGGGGGLDYQIANSVIRWDTSSIPTNATINGATLRVDTMGGSASADGLSWRGEWYVFDGTDADYVEVGAQTARADTAIAGTPLDTANVDYALIGYTSGVNKSGMSGLRLSVSPGTPTGGNLFHIASFDNTTLAGPRLIVDYTEPWDETMRPTSVSGLTNLTGAFTDINADPDGAVGAGLVGTDPSGLTDGPEFVDGPASATVWSGGTGAAFTTYANIIDASDATSTVTTLTSTNTDYQNFFSFAAADWTSLPTNAVITGMSVSLRLTNSNSLRVQEHLTLATANGTIIGNELNVATNSVAATTLGVISTATDQTVNAWSVLPTRAQLVTGTFGVRLRQRRSNTSTITLFSIKATVTYNDTVNTQADAAMGDPVGTLSIGAGTGEIKARFRKKGTGSDPQGRIELRQAGATVGTPIADTTITESDADGQLVLGEFDQDLIDGAPTDVTCRFVGTGTSGSLAELVAVEWNADTQAAAPPDESVTTVVPRSYAYY